MFKSKKDKIDSTINTVKHKSNAEETLQRLFHNRLAVIGFILMFILIFVMVFSSIYYDYEADIINQNIVNRLKSPGAEHWFGTDELGRDVFARVLYGARYSILIALVADIGALLVGSALGAIAAFFGKKVDMIIMRIMDIFMAIPSLLLAIAIVSALGTSTRNLILSLIISGIPTSARMMRGTVLTVRDSDYVESARAIGATNTRIILDHIIPNSLAPTLVHGTLYMAVCITQIASLSFLGLGIQAPIPEWGAMLSAGRNYIRGYSYLTLFPGLAIMITALAFNLIGDGLRDALDPRLK